MFNQMTADLTKPQQQQKFISHKEYLAWTAGFIFDGLRNMRYGQSFCNRFGITDNILYYSRSVSDADRYILENYVR